MLFLTSNLLLCKELLVINSNRNPQGLSKTINIVNINCYKVTLFFLEEETKFVISVNSFKKFLTSSGFLKGIILWKKK